MFTIFDLYKILYDAAKYSPFTSFGTRLETFASLRQPTDLNTDNLAKTLTELAKQYFFVSLHFRS